MTKPSDTAATDASASPVERAFRLLRYIADGGSTANLSDVARQINVNRVTVMRLLESLKAAGLIEAVPPGGALLLKELSGEAAIERERAAQACECAKDPAKARRNVFLSATERQFRSPNRCC